MLRERDRIGELLLRAGVLDERQLEAAGNNQERFGGRLARIVVELGFATEDAVTAAIGRALSMAVMRLGNLPRDSTTLAKLDAETCERWAVFPVQLREEGRTLWLAMADPTDSAVSEQVTRMTGLRVQVALSSESEIQRAIQRLYRGADARPSSPRPLRRVGAPPPKAPRSLAADAQTAPGAPPGDTAPAAPPIRVSPAASPTLGSAAQMLDEILGARGASRAWTEEEIRRLETVRINQEKSARVLRAVRELLAEKGLLDAP